MSPAAVAVVGRGEAAEIRRILALPGPCPDAGEDEVLYTASARFPDGAAADVKLCNGDTPWVDAVLFVPGDTGALSEASVLEPGERVFGRHAFRVDGKAYTVDVQTTKKDGRKGRRARPPKRGSP